MRRPVYLSSSSIRGQRIGEVVEEMARAGITDIELSGGTRHYDSVEADLLRLKQEYGLSYLVHGYFPPPKEDFVIDLVRGRERAFQFFRDSIALAGRLGCDMYSTHAGFTVDALPLTRGEPLGEQAPLGKREAEEILYNNLRSIMDGVAGHDARFAVENMYPLMGRMDYSIVTSPEEILDFLKFSRKYPNLGMLLDLGHLNLAAVVAGFDRAGFVKEVFERYGDKVFEIHISENDGTGDTHGIPEEGSWQLEVAGWDAVRDVPATFEWRGQDSATIIKCYRDILQSPVFA